MSDKKRRKGSFLRQISHVFKTKHKLEQETELDKQAEGLDNRQFDKLESVLHSSDKEIVPLIGKSETCPTVAKDRESNKGMEHKNYNVTKNVHEEHKLEGDRYMSTKIAFLRQDKNVHTTSQSHLKNTNSETEDFHFDSKSTMLQPCSNNANVTNNTHALVVKERKEISQESSEDSDFSADSTENSLEESSEDENDHLIESEKMYLKDEYFTKGKYMTYFFLEMERQFYNPSEVYRMVQYHDIECEKPEKEGIK